MKQVLFRIPGLDLPIYGYGVMLFLAFVFCLWLAKRLGRREGIDPRTIEDMAIWIFIFGILGARVTYCIQFGCTFWGFFRIWDGGLVFYGSAIGGVAGYLLAYIFVLRKHGISSWQMADVIAPCAALGLCLGRIGCLLNGCCYGNVACAECPALSFPLSSPPRMEMVQRGYQTAAGFTLEPDRRVGAVERQSPADKAGLRPGDVIVKVNGMEVATSAALNSAMVREWPRGQNKLALTVRRLGEGDIDLPPFPHGTIGLHPTQIYESISTGLLFFVLLFYLPLRRHDGAVMVLFMFGYAVHRFLNEMLRTDTEPVAFDLTLSQNVSVLVLAAAVLLGLWVHFRPERPTGAQPTPLPA